MRKVTAVFDIGKTNKKFFLFDKSFQEVYREYAKFDEIEDENGFPAEDLYALQEWLKSLFHRILEAKEYDIRAINFSTYGSSFVHLDKNGDVVTPLYNYTKPMDSEVVDSFYAKYGPEPEFAQKTGSPHLGMLNSGKQLYWLKYCRPKLFNKIRYSLHLPQYISYIFTGIPLSEYTSIGCHSSLWDYEKEDYHNWVYQEGFNKILPPVVFSETSINMNYNGKRINIGVGIHDSSAALLPYVLCTKKPFILVSTGTWSISLNPFADTSLTSEDLQRDCINYMRADGRPVKASRLFLGNEYKHQVQLLSAHFGVPENHHRSVRFDYDIFSDVIENFEPRFRWVGIHDDNMPDEMRIPEGSFERAYHQLMVELVLLQVKSIRTAIGADKIKKLFVDGGFSDNDIYIKLLSHYLRDMTLRTTDSSLGSALGAAIVMSDSKLDSKFLKTNYSVNRHVPFIIK